MDGWTGRTAVWQPSAFARYFWDFPFLLSFPSFCPTQRSSDTRAIVVKLFGNNTVTLASQDYALVGMYTPNGDPSALVGVNIPEFIDYGLPASAEGQRRFPPMEISQGRRLIRDAAGNLLCERSPQHHTIVVYC
jgi:hypothetical protein